VQPIDALIRWIKRCAAAVLIAAAGAWGWTMHDGGLRAVAEQPANDRTTETRRHKEVNMEFLAHAAPIPVPLAPLPVSQCLRVVRTP
jgi:hypothetical protein